MNAITAKQHCSFSLLEPLAADFDLKHDTISRHYGVERSMSHPYPALLRAAGLSVVEEREFTLEGQRFLMLHASC